MIMIDDDDDDNNNIKPLIWGARTCNIYVNKSTQSRYWLKFHTQ